MFAISGGARACAGPCAPCYDSRPAKFNWLRKPGRFEMRKILVAATFAAGLAAAGVLAPALHAAAPANNVEFGMMTWPEVKAAIAAGKTTALVYTGGTEQRGPQNVNGGHTLMAEDTVRAIAERLGNAIFLPVLPYTPNRASADLPGTIGLTNEILGAVLTQISEEAIRTGFKNVVLMG